jgi:hypothetical protein
METVTRNVRDLEQSDRSAAERLVGHGLRENQQIIIQVINLEIGMPVPANGSHDDLPAWCNVYEGLTDEQIADIEKSVVRSRASRTFD